MFLTTDDRQFGFWALRRSGESNIGIANRFGISRQAVSRALLLMNRKIEDTLRGMADANQITVEKINPEKGVLLGRSVPFQTTAIVFVTRKSGVQVWYEHDGDCGTCPRYAECCELLWDYATEIGVRIGKTADPTTMADELFKNVKAMV